MEEINTNMYYALIWNTALEEKRVIKGEKITRSTQLPKDPRMLYGTNNNDIAKIVKIDNWMEIRYDIMTQKQSVVFWEEQDEYVIYRDIRIIVWQGEEEITLPSDKYKIVSPDLFVHICRTCCDEISFNINKSKRAENKVVNIVNVESCKDKYCNNDIQITVTPNTIIYKKRVD